MCIVVMKYREKRSFQLKSRFLEVNSTNYHGQDACAVGYSGTGDISMKWETPDLDVGGTAFFNYTYHTSWSGSIRGYACDTASRLKINRLSVFFAFVCILGFADTSSLCAQGITPAMGAGVPLGKSALTGPAVEGLSSIPAMAAPPSGTNTVTARKTPQTSA